MPDAYQMGVRCTSVACHQARGCLILSQFPTLALQVAALDRPLHDALYTPNAANLAVTADNLLKLAYKIPQPHLVDPLVEVSVEVRVGTRVT